jgi:hypothetical protein
MLTDYAYKYWHIRITTVGTELFTRVETVFPPSESFEGGVDATLYLEYVDPDDGPFVEGHYAYLGLPILDPPNERHTLRWFEENDPVDL